MTTLRTSFPLSLFSKNTTAYRDYIEQLAGVADIKINGDRPWDIRVHDERTYQRIISHGSLGAGEAYMQGWWDCESLDEMFTRILATGINEAVETRGVLKLVIAARLQNLQTPKRSVDVAQKHYNISPDLYASMLDQRMIYSCGYWANATTLNEAQEHKLDLVCRKLRLEPGMEVLDIGCGWGGAAKFAAERYGVKVTGITISSEQGATAKAVCKGLPVDIVIDDYRSLSGTYDAIFSIGMFEHVGYKNYATYFDVVSRLLKPDGLFLLHSIGTNLSVTMTDPWIERYIFPNSMLPSAAQITAAYEKKFVMEDWHNFGPDYDTTLMQWHKNFVEAWDNGFADEYSDEYDDEFFRMWNYYLLSSAGSFRSRANQLWQILFSANGIRGGLESVR